HETLPAPASACSGDATITIAPPATPQDLSALDPANCPTAVIEDFHGADPRSALAMSDSVIEDKNFYVLTLLDGAAARTALSTSPALIALANTHAQALKEAANDCNSGTPCWGQAAKWSDADIASAGDALVALHASSTAIQAAATSLRRSGAAQLHATSA